MRRPRPAFQGWCRGRPSPRREHHHYVGDHGPGRDRGIDITSARTHATFHCPGVCAAAGPSARCRRSQRGRGCCCRCDGGRRPGGPGGHGHGCGCRCGGRADRPPPQHPHWPQGRRVPAGRGQRHGYSERRGQLVAHFAASGWWHRAHGGGYGSHCCGRRWHARGRSCCGSPHQPRAHRRRPAFGNRFVGSRPRRPQYRACPAGTRGRRAPCAEAGPYVAGRGRFCCATGQGAARVRRPGRRSGGRGPPGGGCRRGGGLVEVAVRGSGPRCSRRGAHRPPHGPRDGEGVQEGRAHPAGHR